MKNIIKRIQYILYVLWLHIKSHKIRYTIILSCTMMIISGVLIIKSMTELSNINKTKDELLYTKEKLLETQKIVIQLDNELGKIEHTNTELSKELKTKAYLENILKDLSWNWDRK